MEHLFLVSKNPTKLKALPKLFLTNLETCAVQNLNSEKKQTKPTPKKLQPKLYGTMKGKEEKLISNKFYGRTALINKLPSGTEQRKTAPGPCQSGCYRNSLLFPNQERVHNPEHANNRCQLSTLVFSKPLHLECCCFLPGSKGKLRRK